MYLFFDAETNGLPKDWKAPVTDFNNWPRLLQLAYSIYDSEGNKVKDYNFYIKPEGFDTIDPKSALVNKITMEMLNELGIDLETALTQFHKDVDKSEFLIAHNISFDESVVGCEFLRKGFKNIIEEKNRICTMLTTIDYCKIKGPYGNKWPKLSELHKKLFGVDFEDAHDASADNAVTAKCFFELIKNELI